MRWLSSPTRRELTLIIFCLTIFTLAYNVDNSIRFLGFDATQEAVLSRLGFGPIAILKDGRRPSGWRDTLENVIYGAWEWKDGQVAGGEDDIGQEKGAGVHGAIWMSRKEMQSTWSFDGPSVNDGFLKWSDAIPTTSLVYHRPGHTVLEHVVLFNGSVYIVTDTPEVFPNVNSIVYPRSKADKWSIVSTQTAKDVLGGHGGIIHGVSWMSADSSPHNSTLFELWSLHSQQKFREPIWPNYPQRLFLPVTSVFSDPDPDRNLVKEYWLRRVRSDTGFHPYTLKAVFPSLALLYKDDWDDYRNMEVPFVIERLVVVDNEVSSQTSDKFPLENLTPSWWEPIQRNMAKFLDSDEPTPKNKRWGWKQRKTVTYIHRQDARMADSKRGRLSDNSHEALVQALEKFASDYGVHVNFVSALDGDAKGGNNWAERMEAIVKSNVVLGVHGPHLLDAAYMKRSPETTVLEFFSPGTASPDTHAVIDALGMKYLPWWTNR
ncbi:hypothetical protein K435DRAFT_652613 [Dendrothele bispora CBS 962.96]|uniref:Uncharacterized protein n=1 Tax=Dendrothele bispora (strain CBS 962.96) TaxID=1314807 RepID=A0A4S8MJZ0_DENBC|nr:hypothetical protein K435DRAFT_652613 [Dendrothele bispora CBS 962.96]